MKSYILIYLILVFVFPWYMAKWGIQLYAHSTKHTRFALSADAKLNPQLSSFKTLSARFLCCYILLTAIMLALTPRSTAELSLFNKKLFGYKALQIDITLNDIKPKEQQALLTAFNDILQEGHLAINKQGHYHLGRRLLSSRTYTDRAVLKSRYQFKNNHLQIILPNQADINLLWPLEKAWPELNNTANVAKTIKATINKPEQKPIELSIAPRTLVYQRTMRKNNPCEVQLKAQLTAPMLSHLQTLINPRFYDESVVLNIGKEWPGFFKRYHIVSLSELPSIKSPTNPIELKEWLSKQYNVTLHLQTADTKSTQYGATNCNSLAALETPLMAALKLEQETNIAALAPIIKQVKIKPIKRFQPWLAGSDWHEAPVQSSAAGWHWQAP